MSIGEEPLFVPVTDSYCESIKIDRTKLVIQKRGEMRWQTPSTLVDNLLYFS